MASRYQTVDRILAPHEYQTKDLYFAAFLMTNGAIFKRLETIPPLSPTIPPLAPNIFVFVYDSGIGELHHAYFNRQTKVEAQTYADNIRILKAQAAEQAEPTVTFEINPKQKI